MVRGSGQWVTVIDAKYDPDTAPTRLKYQGFVGCHRLELEELASCIARISA